MFFIRKLSIIGRYIFMKFSPGNCPESRTMRMSEKKKNLQTSYPEFGMLTCSLCQSLLRSGPPLRLLWWTAASAAAAKAAASSDRPWENPVSGSRGVLVQSIHKTHLKKTEINLAFNFRYHSQNNLSYTIEHMYRYRYLFGLSHEN